MTETIDASVIRRLVAQGAVEQIMKIIEEKDAKIVELQIKITGLEHYLSLSYRIRMNNCVNNNSFLLD